VAGPPTHSYIPVSQITNSREPELPTPAGFKHYRVP
jgi:hypothetical protein